MRHEGSGTSVTLDAADHEGITLLRHALRSAAYDPDHLRPLLHAEGENVLPRPEDVPVVKRLLPAHDRLADLVRLFLLAEPTSEADAAAALAPLALERAIGLGVVARSEEGLRATIRILPSGGTFIACDRAHESEADLAPDHVMGVATSSIFLASLTVRHPVRDVLDVGCGNGVQSVLAAAHAERVVACDINPRALVFTAFNARLNGTANVETRSGSFFEPVAGQRFDLIVSNPPFVISPDSALTFRDSGLRGDEVSRHVVREAAAHLSEGGLAFVLVSWGVRVGEEWDAPLRGWVAGLGCDAWFLHHARGTVLGYAATWNSAILEVDPARYERTIDRWTAYYRELGYDSIGYGATILRKRAGKAHWTRADDIHGQREPASGAQIARLIDAEDFLARSDDAAVLRARFAIEPGHRLDQVLRARGGAFVVDEATLRIEAGLRFSTTIDAFSADLLARLDGTRTLRDAAAETAAHFSADGLATDEVAREAVVVGRRLLALGLIRVADG